MVGRAFNLMLRRATKSLLPSATGAVASPKTFQRTITTLIKVQQQSVALRNFLPAASRFFFGGAIKNIDNFLRIIESEPPVVSAIPVGSPFEIYRVPVGSPFETIVKSCQESAESVTYHNDRYNDETVFFRPEKNGENSGNSESSATVGILKHHQECTVLVFRISALDGEIRIPSLAFVDLNCCDDPFDCDPHPCDFSVLDENLQAAFYKYLAGRGITADWYVENDVLYFR